MLIKNTPPQSQSNRLLGLDLFRIFLAVLIYAFHSYIHLRCQYGVLDKFVWEGAVAMTGFFLLSGFSLQISSSKMDFTDVRSLKAFYTKRLISIMPLYFFVHILKMFWENNEPLVNRVLMFPIQTLGIQAQFSTLFNHTHNGGTWFISCLLASYFVFPLVHVILEKLNVKQSLVLLFILVFVLLWSPLVQIFVGTNNIYDNPFFRFLEFSIGMNLYNLWMRMRNNKWLVRIFNWQTAVASFYLASLFNWYPWLLYAIQLGSTAMFHPYDIMLGESSNTKIAGFKSNQICKQHFIRIFLGPMYWIVDV